LFWQLCLQVWAWLSQALKQGGLNVVGHTLLQESFWLAQLAKQASVEASANRHLPLLKPAPAIAVPMTAKKSAAPNTSFIRNSEFGSARWPKPSANRSCASSARAFVVDIGLVDHELLDLVTGLESGGQPSRLFPATRPGFRRLIGISILWINPRIFPPLTRRSQLLGRCGVHLILTTKLRKAFLKFALLGSQANGQSLTDLLVQFPHLVHGHRVQVYFLVHARLLVPGSAVHTDSSVSIRMLDHGFPVSMQHFKDKLNSTILSNIRDLSKLLNSRDIFGCRDWSTRSRSSRQADRVYRTSSQKIGGKAVHFQQNPQRGLSNKRFFISQFGKQTANITRTHCNNLETNF
jgi:hypothetical protein